VRVLIDAVTGAAPDLVDAARLARMYAPPRLPWLRVNMVSTVDGAATGATGRSGSINNAADKVVFDLLRATADAIIVGAGTARAEGYRPAPVPIVLVSRTADVPDQLRGAPAGRVLMATCSAAAGLTACRAVLGPDNVIVAGSDTVDLAAMREALVDRGLRRLLGEGGPTLLSAMLAAGVVDELCATLVPRLLAGSHPRITSAGFDVDVALDLSLLLEEAGTLLGRWLVAR
jgi:riboflavin biosynthesis pyrimidine reductase